MKLYNCRRNYWLSILDRKLQSAFYLSIISTPIKLKIVVEYQICVEFLVKVCFIKTQTRYRIICILFSEICFFCIIAYFAFNDFTFMWILYIYIYVCI